MAFNILHLGVDIVLALISIVAGGNAVIHHVAEFLFLNSEFYGVNNCHAVLRTAFYVCEQECAVAAGGFRHQRIGNKRGKIVHNLLLRHIVALHVVFLRQLEVPTKSVCDATSNNRYQYQYPFHIAKIGDKLYFE